MLYVGSLAGSVLSLLRMPVYIRKNISYTPPSLANFVGEDNDDDFVADPEQVRDTLPQPYRMLDKILGNILDDVWETIAARESERLAEGSRLKLPRYEYSTQMTSLLKTNCLACSEDGELIFAGLPNGLAAVDSGQQVVLAVWEDQNSDIVQINTSLLSPNMHLISTVDDMGFARMFAYSGEKFHLLKAFNEQDGSSSKVIASHCECSRGGDYAGIVLENPGTCNLWLEVHRIPKDAWIKELENLLPKKDMSSIQIEKPPSPQVILDVTEGTKPEGLTRPDVEATDQKPKKGGKQDSPSKQKSGKAASRKKAKSSAEKTAKDLLTVDTLPSVPSAVSAVEATPEKTSVKFSHPNLVLKVRPPNMPSAVGAKNSSSQGVKKASGPLTTSQACKAADGPDVIGTGAQHLLTQQHLDQRQALFEQLHDNVKKYIPKYTEETMDTKLNSPPAQPTFHFLNSGFGLTTGMEQLTHPDRPLAVSVWWAGSCQLYQYSLLKGGKDTEYKPETVWPFSSAITCTAVTPCTSLLGVGLDSGNVVIWDRFVGVEKGVLDVSNSPVKDIQFLDPSICLQEGGTRPAFGSKTAFYLLVLCQDGCLYLNRCGASVWETSRPVLLSKRTEEGESITMLKPLPVVSRVVLHVLRNGSIYLQDVVTGQFICQIVLPPPHNTASPWQPVLAAGNGGQMLYVKGAVNASTLIQSEEENSAVPDEPSIFVFQLRSFPSLDKFWEMERSEIPFVVSGTVQDRVNELMKQRITEQVARKKRLQDRWEFFSTELEKIREQRVNRRLASAKSSYAESSIPRTPVLLPEQLSSIKQAG